MVSERIKARIHNLASAHDVYLDFYGGIRAYRFWWKLSYNDIRTRYRRTLLGPWWLVLGNMLALGAMAIVWSTLFGIELAEFFPYLVAGYVTWLMIVSYITEGCTVFVGGSAAAIQRNIALPKTIHAIRLVARSLLLFLHNIVVFVFVAVFFEVPVSIWVLTVVPAVILVALNGVWISILMGILNARYRDIEPLAGALMLFLFLVTPIMWRPEMLGSRGYIASFNPITHMIAIVREPLLGGPPSITSWMVCLCLLIGGYTVSFALMLHSKHRIIYWL